MSLPLMTLDHDAFGHNTALMLKYAAQHGIAIAPHAKTPMSPDLAGRLVESGAWGATVADIRQAAVMLERGIRRLILANEIGGPAAAQRLAATLARFPDVEFHVFVDSVELVEALAAAWRGRKGQPTLGLLVEVGAARAGARTLAVAEQVLAAALAAETGSFRISGVASYEGAAAVADPAETSARIARLMQLTVDIYRLARRCIGVGRPLLVTAGGSAFFDLVVAGLKPALTEDPNATLMLRSGAIFFHDHGVYERGLTVLDARGGFDIDGRTEPAARRFRPALRVWAEILSRPEAALAIAGMGLRDVAADQGLPCPLAIYRDGTCLRLLQGASVKKLNDQHAFLEIATGDDVRIGDVVEFGLSHPCTCLDRYAVIYEVDADHMVTAALPSSFG
jgi:D-serine dehydratase